MFASIQASILPSGFETFGKGFANKSQNIGILDDFGRLNPLEHLRIGIRGATTAQLPTQADDYTKYTGENLGCQVGDGHTQPPVLVDRNL
jgi:hypothetical protein